MSKLRFRTAPNRLREARQFLFNSAKAFASRAGVSYTTYINHENGERGMDFDTLERYADALGVSPGWLAFGEGSKIDSNLPALLRAAADRLEAVESEVEKANSRLAAVRKAIG